MIEWARNTAESENSNDYIYKPSNYYLEEIEARKSELQGEKSGLYTLTDAYRQEREEQILMYNWNFERAKVYEATHNLKPDGIHQ